MAQVLVRNLPDDVVARLKEKAARSNVSLEQYLRDLLQRETATNKAEALERLHALRESSPVIEFDATETIREEREQRGEHLWRVSQGLE